MRDCMKTTLKNRNKQQNKGITLIALVITIIVLLILAGVGISTLTGEGGILGKAKTAGVTQEEQEAKEKLELVLQDLTISKHTDPTYNQGKYINDAIEKENMTIVEDMVMVDGWQFEIDRSVPKIVIGLGKGKENETIGITASATITTDYVKANLEANITFEGKIQEIIIKGTNLEVPTPENGVYTVTQEVEENGTYTILVKDEQGNYKIEKVEVTDITEDMDIWNRADMETFRDKVNSGRTFEGRTVRVKDNIDLEGSASNQWTPIAEESGKFKGTLEGNNYNIQNLYIDNTKAIQGLFGFNNGTIQNVVIENGFVKSTQETIGLLVATNEGKIKNVVTKGRIEGPENVGGIVGRNFSDKEDSVELCINYAMITYNKSKQPYGYRMGGIVGRNDQGKVGKSINRGNVGGGHSAGGIVGVNGNAEVNQCINYGEISEAENVAGIVACNGWNARGIIRNCMNIGKITTENKDVKRSGGIVALAIGGGNGYSLVENCYNIGEIAPTQYIGGTIGVISVKDKDTYEMKNNYWLKKAGINYGVGSMNYKDNTGNNTNAEPKTEAELKTLAETLGEAYTNDEQNLRSGYLFIIPYFT